MVCQQRFTVFLFWLLITMVLAAVFLVAASPVAAAPVRYALVIGNGDYQSGPLKNPVNDSRDMQVLLEKLGFKVTHLENADLSKMMDAVYEFSRNLKREKGIGLFYYAGHGMQVKGRNYLIPVGARIRAEFQIQSTSFDVAQVLGAMDEAGNRANIVILDACRDNPFARSFRSAAKGLAQIDDSPDGTLIAYATSPGRTALDGEGRNSPYTKALLKYLQEPGLSITRVFQLVRKEVKKTTSRKQKPWETTSLTDEVILVAGGSAFYSTPAVLPPTGTAPTTGSLTIKTRPAGAQISISGRSRGRAPLTLKKLSPGRMPVKAVLSGYEPAAKTVLIRAGRQSNLTLLLDKIITTGTIKITSTPAGAEWYLDGAYVGLTPDTLSDVEKGSHIILVKKSGYRDWTKTPTIQSRKEVLISVDLKQVPRKVVDQENFEPLPSAGSTFTDPSTGMVFVWVPEGCFQMGSNGGDLDEKPAHKVCVDGFWMGKYEVTQGQWQRIMGYNPSDFQRGKNYPVENISWDDCQSFIRKFNTISSKTFRLPTEAEWEYACNSGWNEEYSKGGYAGRAWYHGNNVCVGPSTHAVGGKSANSFGLYDMIGNVWEWCSDWYDSSYYNNSPMQNPQGASLGTFRVARGSCWRTLLRYIHVADRRKCNPTFRGNGLGFRLVSSGRR